jgi:hypothetical protein
MWRVFLAPGGLINAHAQVSIGRQTNLLARLQAALVDRYTIERELGRGGMATVYLARDLKHHRPVAIKVLKPELAAALGPERFLREIEIAAGLNHARLSLRRIEKVHCEPRSLAARGQGYILEHHSDAMNPEARCRAARPCLEGSKSRNRLSGVPAWPFFLIATHQEAP